MHTPLKQAESHRRILLVAGDASVCEAYASRLRTAGHETESESDADEAEDALRQHPYEILVIEHKILGKSALRLLLKASHENLTLPVVLITDAPLACDLQSHCRLRSVTVLSKPFPIESLLNLVLTILRASQAARRIQDRLPLTNGFGPRRDQNHETERSPFSTDETLMLAIQDQRGAGLEELYRRHATLLRGVIYRVVRNHADVDDVLQDVFVEIWDRSKTYLSEKGRPLGWMITLSRRRAIDRVRRIIAHHHATSRFELEGTMTGGDSPPNQAAEALHATERRDVIASILKRLPDKQREAIEMAYFHGLSQRKIAAVTGSPVGTIKTRIQLALHKIERFLKSFSIEFIGRSTAMLGGKGRAPTKPIEKLTSPVRATVPAPLEMDRPA
jgi:RNA polymerase sigma-70 factor (ECF subfamily)